MIYHVDKDNKPLCGAWVHTGMQLVDRPERATCTRCEKLAGITPSPHAIELIVNEPPPRDVVLVDLIELLCEAAPGDRVGLCEEALSRLGLR